MAVWEEAEERDIITALDLLKKMNSKTAGTGGPMMSG